MVQNDDHPLNGSASLGTKLPEMFSKYKSSVEHELHRVVPDFDKSEAYRLLRYHLGWIDQKGNRLDLSLIHI